MNSTHNPWKDVIEFQTKVLGVERQPELGKLTTEDRRHLLHCLAEELDEIRIGLNDNVEVSDGLVDLIYFAYGFAYKLGLPFPAIWDLVHAANMRKVKGFTHRGVPDDASKPADWVDPKVDITKLLTHEKFKKQEEPARRPTIHHTMMRMASALAERATCDKLQVGCVLTDSNDRVLSAGYNGPARGRSHCGNTVCWDHCQATHAESNAIISCHAPSREIRSCYTTWSPCVACCKQLIQTGCQNIYYMFESEEFAKAEKFWLRDSAMAYRSWQKLLINEP